MSDCHQTYLLITTRGSEIWCPRFKIWWPKISQFQHEFRHLYDLYGVFALLRLSLERNKIGLLFSSTHAVSHSNDLYSAERKLVSIWNIFEETVAMAQAVTERMNRIRIEAEF